MIYLVAVLDNENGYRVWGYYNDKETAIECVMNNWSDISERGYYQYGLVISIGEGPLSCAEEELWYRFTWDYANGGIVSVAAIDKPEEFEGTSYGF